MTTLELSKTIKRYIFKKKLYNKILNISSIPISKFELLKLIKKTFKKEVKIKKCSKIKLNRTLNSKKFTKITGYKCPSWKKLLKEIYVVYKKDYERI